jgi:orotate phosphoribosyltransferase
MFKYLIEGGHPLHGSIRPSGNKNAALPCLAATLLTSEPVVLRNLPEIEDVQVMIEILRLLGSRAEKIGDHAWRLESGDPAPCAVPVELARQGRNVPFAYNRKEAKDHGEGGNLVGAPVAGRVVIIYDVISAGTSVRESIALIRAAGAAPVAVAIALDRQERAAEGGVDKPSSAVQYVISELGMDVIGIATLADLLEYLSATGDPTLAPHAARVVAYRDRYGV